MWIGTCNRLSIGAAGELLIGGDGVVRGYFEPAGIDGGTLYAGSVQAGGRLYRTGDLARYRADGRSSSADGSIIRSKCGATGLNWGRSSRVLLHPAVKEAVVVVARDGAEDKRLVAYLTDPLGPGDRIPGTALRSTGAAARAHDPDGVCSPAILSAHAQRKN